VSTGGPAHPERTGPRIDGGRLLRRLEALGEISPIDGGGNARLALSDADKAGRDLVVTWMHDLGLDVRIDAIGNVFATMRLDGPAGERAPVMTGSHIDTVRTGGRYDGNYGVLAGLEVIEAVLEHGTPLDRPLAVAFFTNEEGARFAPDMLGSLVHVGGLAVETALDTVAVDGARLGDELTRIGYAGSAPCPGPAPHAFVELHIEQGPVLDLEGIRIGVVEQVQGISWQELTITGQSNHAGTTPMRFRRDAGFAAARLAVEAREIARSMGGDQVGTVGAITLHPNLVNVVAARAVMTVDLRNTDESLLRLAEQRFAAAAAQVERDEGVTITSRPLARFEPVAFDPRVIDLVERFARDAGLSTRHMPSGAGHDAQMLARVCPTGMIFVPSIDGLSHNPAERTAPDDLVAGAEVLLHTLLALTRPGTLSGAAHPATGRDIEGEPPCPAS
jgi:N-carbamoyl-L-amino-acid hydrolase